MYCIITCRYTQCIIKTYYMYYYYYSDWMYCCLYLQTLATVGPKFRHGDQVLLRRTTGREVLSSLLMDDGPKVLQT